MRCRAPASLFALILVLLATAPGSAQDEAARDDRVAQVEAMLQDVFAGIWQVASSSATGLQKRDAIASRLAESLDYAALARGALGAQAERFSREEYADFAREYARYITWLLVQRTADAERQAELVEVRYDPEKDVVRARALGRDRRKLFMFQRNQAEGRSELSLVLRKTYGEWRVAALGIDAIDVTQMFREQFQAVLARDEPATLIEDLRRRNRESEGIDPFEARDR